MKALRFETYGPPSVLSIQDLPLPALQEEKALVQIKASSINPSDVGTVAGRFHSQLPMTPGRDFAGIVVEGGNEWKGKQVWGTGAGFGVVRVGAHAEFVAVPSSWLSEKPEALSMEQAAVVGVPYLAAWQSLIEAAGLQKRERLLITGAAERWVPRRRKLPAGKAPQCWRPTSRKDRRMWMSSSILKSRIL